MPTVALPPGIPRSAIKGFENAFVGGVGGVGRQAARYGDDAVGVGTRVWRSTGGKLFSRGGPKKAPVSSSPTIARNPVQAGDDVIRAIDNPVPTPPLAGRPLGGNFPTSFVVKSAVVGGGAVAAYQFGPKLVGPEGPIGAAGETATKIITEGGQATGGALADVFGGLGAGLANLFAGAGAGAGVGLGAGLTGIGEGLRKVAGPLIILGGAALLGFAAAGRVGKPTRRR